LSKKTDTELAPEPIGWLKGWNGDEQQPVLVFECPKCLSLTTSLVGHELYMHPAGI
jgi:hypothetical protein